MEVQFSVRYRLVAVEELSDGSFVARFLAQDAKAPELIAAVEPSEARRIGSYVGSLFYFNLREVP